MTYNSADSLGEEYENYWSDSEETIGLGEVINGFVNLPIYKRIFKLLYKMTETCQLARTLPRHSRYVKSNYRFCIQMSKRWYGSLQD